MRRNLIAADFHPELTAEAKQPMRTRQDGLAPIHLYGKLWHVGDKGAPAYLLDTGDGLLLIDSGLPGTCDRIVGNIHELGWEPRNLRWILHSHGHVDHLGSTRKLAALSGAETLIGAPDRAMAAGRAGELTFASELGIAQAEPFEPDRLLRDGDVLRFGRVAVRCAAAPGHTRGTMAFFFDLEEDGAVRRAGMHGGLGFNTMTSAYLARYALSPECRREFAAGLERLKHEKVDIVVGNHLSQNRTMEKLARRQAEPSGANPFVDPAEWERLLTGTLADFRDFEQKDPIEPRPASETQKWENGK